MFLSLKSGFKINNFSLHMHASCPACSTLKRGMGLGLIQRKLFEMISDDEIIVLHFCRPTQWRSEGYCGARANHRSWRPSKRRSNSFPLYPHLPPLLLPLYPCLVPLLFPANGGLLPLPSFSFLPLTLPVTLPPLSLSPTLPPRTPTLRFK